MLVYWQGVEGVERAAQWAHLLQDWKSYLLENLCLDSAERAAGGRGVV